MTESNEDKAQPGVGEDFLAAILDSLKEPVLVADLDHIICYMNAAAARHYPGGRSLLGTSAMDCHKPESREMILRLLARLQAGEDEICYQETEARRVYIRAVRDPQGKLLGYYEWFQPPPSP